MVVILVRGAETWSAGYGHVAPGSNDKPDATSLLRLCSISKVLATDLLAKLVAEQKVSLDDPLQKYAPEGVTVPEKTVHGPAERPITLRDLATHTAGLPREIAYPPAGMAHFTFPDYDFRWQWLPQYRLRSQPGDAAHYSNIGFDLLADALSAATGQQYLDLFEDMTAKPLGMVDTTLTPSPEQCERLMSGAREPSECSDTRAAAGSGGIYSTANDMALFMRYLLKLPGVPFHQSGSSTAMVIDPAKLRSVQGLGHAGVPTGIGLGWVEINADHAEARIVQKTGGGAGFQTYIALNPAKHAGIFIAVTEGRHHGGINMFREANDLLLKMVGLPPVPVDPNDPERERTADELEEAAVQQKAAKASRARPGVRAKTAPHAAAPAAKRRGASKATTHLAAKRRAQQ
jgi:D-alanyl-D-alanine-carboxypeptidase/D-alanyl-D-alanine-endopeptidase